MKKQKDPYQHVDYEFCIPKNEKQHKYISSLNEDENKILFAIGPAGTGKTLIACNHAIKLLLTNSIQKIVITRPIVPVEEEEHGFLPGNINKKMDPWLRPIFDIFLDKYSRTQLDRMIFDNIIEIAPLGFMRGRTFKNTLVIADEMQNSTPNQMKMLLTRIGSNSKLIVTGDINQNDISSDKISGLSDIIDKTKRYFLFMKTKYGEHIDKSVQIIEFDNKDIERSKVVKKILDIYNVEKMFQDMKKSDTNIEGEESFD
jgi:phosphate starvation-inducible PhoH-like protein